MPPWMPLSRLARPCPLIAALTAALPALAAPAPLPASAPRVMMPTCHGIEGGVLAQDRWGYTLQRCGSEHVLRLLKVDRPARPGVPPLEHEVDRRSVPTPGARPASKGEPGTQRSMDFVPCVKKGTEQFVLAAAVWRTRPDGRGTDLVGWEGAWGFDLKAGRITTAFPGELACEVMDD